MLSGVASEKETTALVARFSNGELVRMLSLIQQTAAGFTRSTSRRLDAELCIVNLCQPELVLDAEALNARLSRLEDQLRTGSITVVAAPAKQEEFEDDRPPMPDDMDAPPEDPYEIPEAPAGEEPLGFWTEVSAQVYKELKPPVKGFFAPTPNAPIRGVLQGDQLKLVTNSFTMEIVNKPEILELVSRKASAKLGRKVRAVVVDQNSKNVKSKQMEQLLQFGRAHSDIIKIKE